MIQIGLPNATWLGAPSVPREIVLAPPGSVTGLLFRPLPEMSLLHAGAASNTSLALSPSGGWQDIKRTDGLHAHLLVTLTIPDFATIVSLEIRGAGTKPGAPGSVIVTVSRGVILLGGQFGQFDAPFPASLSNSSIVELEIFVDGTATEVFANGGERALTSSAPVLAIEGSLLRATAINGTATLQATTWAMKRSVNV